MRSHDELIPLALTPPLLPPLRKGRPPTVETVRRWAREGQLETVRFGGVYFTTAAAIRRFLERRSGEAPKPALRNGILSSPEEGKTDGR